MTTPATRAGRALNRLRHSYTITCAVCGRSAEMRSKFAKVCARVACRREARTRSTRLRRLKAPHLSGEQRQKEGKEAQQ